MPKKLIAAHDQKISHSYLIHYPEHGPRESDPYYSDFHAYKAGRRAAGTYTCDFAVEHRNGDTSECDLTKPLECHHRFVEFAVLNAVDLTLLEKDFPGISEMPVGKWVESDQNLMILCATSSSPVLMADGSELPISEVRPGDAVITKDGSSQIVQGISRNKYRGDVFTFGSTGLTPSHRVLTEGGWRPVSEISRQLWVDVPDVIRVRRVEYQIGADVITPDAVDVVDTLGSFQRPSDKLLHYVPMLHDEFSAGEANADVAFGCQVSCPVLERCVRARQSVQPDHPAGIGAVVSSLSHKGRPDYALGSADRAVNTDRPVAVLDESPAHSAALGGTTRVALRQGFRDKELLLAGHAPLRDQRGPVADTRWDALGEVRQIAYSGWVHDLIIPHNQSYVSSGVVVHNCVFHHRGHSGVHTASASDFGSTFYVRGLIG
jgi:hypothetical protein